MGVILERSEESQSGGIRQRLPTTRFFVVPMLSGLLQNDRPIVLRQAHTPGFPIRACPVLDTGAGMTKGGVFHT
ncbi:MAG: hypothetical protein Q8O43_04840, partial [Dehalococcoidia bacterium]|nr:hypothetical protein [Dehalococcoidia bacterium]